MCANLELYHRFKEVPAEAKKPISAGRLKGKTDINPMWRIKMLTQEFGVCGFGWYTNVDKMWLETGANGEVTANVQISLYVKRDGEWSMPIIGIGGAAFISNEKNGSFTDDDCFKKAYTDAISIACKALGMAASVYYEKDPESKYTARDESREDLPFPEAAKPSPALTYETALDLVFNGEKLRDIYKRDRQLINTIYNDPNTPAEVKTAICLINAVIVKSQRG